LPTVDVHAPMTGTVLEVKVRSGQAVAVGDELVVVESMKMEIPVECEQAGTVRDILVAIDGHIDEGDIILRLETA
jgi:acetyl-CoA carboxylase biotin carboxyl carrier protein